jgi:dTDP-4-dehydrorhamnose 3,5-epimerase
MEIRGLRLHGTYEIKSDPHHDDRGYFMRVYDESCFCGNELNTRWVQESESFSKHNGTIRGLHFQNPPHSEIKLVRVVAGAVMDVFVDLRKESKTFGKWDSIILNSTMHNMVYVPKGFAHGFCTLSSNTIVLYKMDSAYCPEFQSGIKWNDLTLNITWPTKDPHISERDTKLPSFDEFVSPF